MNMLPSTWCLRRSTPPLRSTSFFRPAATYSERFRKVKSVRYCNGRVPSTYLEHILNARLIELLRGDDVLP